MISHVRRAPPEGPDFGTAPYDVTTRLGTGSIIGQRAMRFLSVFYAKVPYLAGTRI
jgi:hypothetical protein